MLKNVEVVVPEFILDEEGHHGPYRPKKAAGVAYGVQRQVANDVGSVVVFTHFVARRREEREQNLILRVLVPNAFDQRTPLFELTE